jgi:DNA polymerase III subunit gamma/tau
VTAEPSEPVDRRALYLRWRPRTFGDVVSQEAVTRTLKNAIVRGTVAHAYLLCGPRGTGKTSLARILYRALNCERPIDGEPCGECSSCVAADAGAALDLIEIDAASNRGIDDIRSLREGARFVSNDARTKVYILDEAHQLTAPAWDAFLKTLEEPPPNTVFVLATTAAHKVPATIVSRCQRFDLGRIPQNEITEHLNRVAEREGYDLEAGVADRVARLARGGMRDAIGMLEQVAVFAGSPVTLDAARRVLGLVRGDALRTFVDALSLRDSRRALQVLEDVAQEGADLRQFLDEVLFYVRGALLIRAGADAATASDFAPDEREWLRGVAQRWSPGEITAILRAYGESEDASVDDRALLLRLELATVSSTSLAAAIKVPAAPPYPGPPALQGKEGATSSPRREEVVAEFITAFPNAPAPGARGETAAPPQEGREDETVLSPDAPRQEGVEETASADESVPSSQAVQDQDEVASPSTQPVSSPLMGEGAPVPSAAPTLSAQHGLSLAAVEARWPAIVEGFQADVYARLLLQKLSPAQLDDSRITLAGRIDPLDIRRLEEKCRRPLEALLAEDLGVGLAVRFVASDAPSPSPSLDDFATGLFGGSIVPG